MRKAKFKNNKMQNTNQICAEYQQQGGRSWRIFANLTQYNMQYIPCNSALLAQETLFLNQKGTFFTLDFQKVRKMRQILISQQNSENVIGRMQFSYKSKLFCEGPSWLRTTASQHSQTSQHSHSSEYSQHILKSKSHVYN